MLILKRSLGKVKDPCSVCSKSVSKNQKAIQCSECQLWSHASCNGIGKSGYAKLTVESDEVPWFCIPCLILANSEIFPFRFLPTTELCNLLGIHLVDLPSQVELLPSFEITSKLTNLPNLNSCGPDENLVQTINSKYYKVQELRKLCVTSQINNFSLFHVNIRCLTKHFEELQSLLYSSKIPFDVIGIPKSKQPVKKNFLTNVNLHEYQLHSQPTESACGGVAMSVKNDHKVLNNLNALKDEFETLWIEVNTGPKCKNIIVCCAYKHPDTGANKFIEYLESTLSKLDKNRIICIMGDFNIYLLNYDSYGDTNEFIYSMVSHCLLPHILQPTRATDHSATVIDNIFTNANDFDTTSDNILNRLAYHFSPFFIFQKLNINRKDSAFYKYDYSNFDKDNFVSDFAKINWNENKNTTLGDVNVKFYNFYDKVSICVKTCSTD